MGIPITQLEALTSFEDANSIISELVQEGVSQFSVIPDGEAAGCGLHQFIFQNKRLPRRKSLLGLINSIEGFGGRLCVLIRRFR